MDDKQFDFDLGEFMRAVEVRRLQFGSYAEAMRAIGAEMDDLAGSLDRRGNPYPAVEALQDEIGVLLTIEQQCNQRMANR